MLSENGSALKSLIIKNNKTLKATAFELGLTYEGFYAKIKGKSDFTVAEINILRRMFGSDEIMDIFFKL